MFVTKKKYSVLFNKYITTLRQLTEAQNANIDRFLIDASAKANPRRLDVVTREGYVSYYATRYEPVGDRIDIYSGRELIATEYAVVSVAFEVTEGRK